MSALRDRLGLPTPKAEPQPKPEPPKPAWLARLTARDQTGALR